MKGFLLIDKEKGKTSFDVIRDLRNVCGIKKIGHAGTLDPLATGLLLIAIGEGTKLLEHFIGLDKDYEVDATFGFVSDTFDADGELSKADFIAEIGADIIKKHISESFLGEIKQIPPKYSALKVDGKRAYDLAREGVELKLEPRNVTIEAFDLLEFAWPRAKFKVSCSSGTYIRSLIHDLGQVLGSGAYVEELRRTRVGDFFVQDAVKVGDLVNKVDQFILPLEAVIRDFECLNLSRMDMSALSDGKVSLSNKIDHPLAMGIYDGRLVGILKSVPGGIRFSKIIH